VRFFLSYLSIAVGVGTVGIVVFAMLFTLVSIAPDGADVWDALNVVKLYALPCAALTFHLASKNILGRRPNLLVEMLLFGLVEWQLTPFFEFVVKSSLTGPQGIAIAVAGLTLAGWVVAANSPECPGRWVHDGAVHVG
jgi:hypothetical protein